MLERYLWTEDGGETRRLRAKEKVGKARKRREGVKTIDIPIFWKPCTTGYTDASAKRGLVRRTKTEQLWASPHFAWKLFKGLPPKGADPRHAFRELVERLMPNYFDLLGARYGIDGLISEAAGSLDCAFLAANWRYTKIVSQEAYRAGLAKWPAPGWNAGCAAEYKKMASSQGESDALPGGASAASGATPGASSHEGGGGAVTGGASASSGAASASGAPACSSGGGTS